MRREHKVTLMLSADEFAKLRELALDTGLSQSSLLRSVLYVAQVAGENARRPRELAALAARQKKKTA